MNLAYGTWDEDWKTELSEIREEIADDIHRFRKLEEAERHAFRSRLHRNLPEELHADVDQAFEKAMRRTPTHPPLGVCVDAPSHQRPRKAHRERRTQSTVGNDNATSDDNPPGIGAAAPLQNVGAEDGCNDADLLAPSRPLTDSEKAFMAGLAELALQATLEGFQRHAEENKSKEGGAS